MLQKLEAMIRKIISGMFFEVESQKVAKPFFVFWCQNLFGCSQKIIVADRKQGARVIRDGLIGDQVIASGVIKERIAVVKQGSRGNDMIGFIIYKETKVPKVAICIEDQSIQYQHIIQGLGPSFS